MISVKSLTITDTSGRHVVDDVSLEVVPGLDVGIVGQSGSGKSTTALAMLGRIRPGLCREAGEILVDGEDILRASQTRVRALRRTHFAYLGQDPSASLTPTMRVGRLVTELAVSPRTDENVLARLSSFGLPDDPDILRRFPHELSGGQRQRVALARALTNDPSILILDEPTTGLDSTTQRMVLDEVAAVVERSNLTMVVISHDLSVVARFAETLIVMRGGAVVDTGSVGDLLTRPANDYTRHLVAIAPRLVPGRCSDQSTDSTTMLRIDGLHASHHTGRAAVPALTDVNLSIPRGGCLAVVGPSGSGKTTLARCIIGLHLPDRGSIVLDHEELAASARRRPTEHRRRVQLVPQDAGGSLNPRRRVADVLARPLRRLRNLRDGDEVREEIARLLDLVHLERRVLNRRSGELSGGERQRVALARALATTPDVLVCDEMTSALDTSVQHEILQLVKELRLELGLTTVFITHDLGVVSIVADRVAVLAKGGVCEEGPTAAVLGAPTHELTRSLVECAPSLDQELATRRVKVGEP